MRANEAFLRRSSVLLVFALISRFLGLGRDIVLAWLFGAGLAGDLLAAALRIPHVFRRLLAEGSLSLSLTNTLIRFGAEEGKKYSLPAGNAAYYLYAAVSRRLFLLLLFLAIVFFLLSPLLADILYPNAGNEKATLGSLLSLLCPYLFFVGLAAPSMAYLHARSVFVVSAFSPILFNLCFLLFILLAFFYREQGLYLVAFGMSCAGFVQWFWQWGAVRLRLTPAVPAPNDISGRLAQLVSQRILREPAGFLAFSLQHLAFMCVLPFLAAGGEGKMAAFFYAERILEFPLGSVGVCLAIAALPEVSALAAEKRFLTFGRTLDCAVHWTLLLILPCMTGLFAVGPTLLATIFAHGNFDAKALFETSRTLMLLLPLLPALALSRVYLGALVALSGTGRTGLLSVLSLIFLLLLLCSPLEPLHALLLGLWTAFLLLFFFLAHQAKRTGLCLSFPGSFLVRAILVSLAPWFVATHILAFASTNSTLLLCLALIAGIFAWFLALRFVCPRDYARFFSLLAKKLAK